GDTLTVTALTQPANGTASINLDYTVTYTPADSFIGGDTFTYTIDDGNGGTDTATVTVTVEPPPAPTIHVGNLQGQSAKLSKGRWEASVTVTVHDEDHIAVSDAWVTGVWSGAMTGTESLPTAGGIVTFTNSTKGGKSATFTVTNITLAGYDYDAADNHATSITVSK
ncbi:MAG: Ig-like domain-containing protein, partial [Planctomycetota bacterium]